MKPYETIKLAIPVVLIQEGDHFIVSCDSLALYSQSSSIEKAEEGFLKSIDHFFKVLLTQGEGVFESYLFSKQVVSMRFAEIKVGDLPKPDLKLGVYQNWYVPAKASPPTEKREPAFA